LFLLQDKSHDITIASDIIYYLIEATFEYDLATKEDGPNHHKKKDLVPEKYAKFASDPNASISDVMEDECILDTTFDESGLSYTALAKAEKRALQRKWRSQAKQNERIKFKPILQKRCFNS
jgi:hypothetical protein